DVIRDWSVTQAQTCPLPISADHRVGSVATDIAGYRSGGPRLHYRLIGVIWRFADYASNWRSLGQDSCVAPDVCCLLAGFGLEWTGRGTRKPGDFHGTTIVSITVDCFTVPRYDRLE